MTNKYKLLEIRELIAQDNLGQAFIELSNIVLDSEKSDELILLKARYSDLEKQKRLGIIDLSEKEQLKNNIRVSMISLVNEQEKRFRNDIKIKIGNHSKSMPVNQKMTHYGSGDNIGGDKNINM